MIKEKLWLGVAYRTSVKLYPKPALQNDLRARSAIGLVTEFFVRENLRIGYGYDYSLNKLGSYDYGSHEISIGYYLQTAKAEGQSVTSDNQIPLSQISGFSFSSASLNFFEHILFCYSLFL